MKSLFPEEPDRAELEDKIYHLTRTVAELELELTLAKAEIEQLQRNEDYIVKDRQKSWTREVSLKALAESYRTMLLKCVERLEFICSKSCAEHSQFGAVSGWWESDNLIKEACQTLEGK